MNGLGSSSKCSEQCVVTSDSSLLSRMSGLKLVLCLGVLALGGNREDPSERSCAGDPDARPYPPHGLSSNAFPVSASYGIARLVGGCGKKETLSSIPRSGAAAELQVHLQRRATSTPPPPDLPSTHLRCSMFHDSTLLPRVSLATTSTTERALTRGRPRGDLLFTESWRRSSSGGLSDDAV